MLIRLFTFISTTQNAKVQSCSECVNNAKATHNLFFFKLDNKKKKSRKMHTYGYGDGASEGDLVAAVNINIELNQKKNCKLIVTGINPVCLINKVIN